MSWWCLIKKVENFSTFKHKVISTITRISYPSKRIKYQLLPKNPR